LRKVEEWLDSCEVTLITQREKGLREAVAVTDRQELELYAQFLEEVAGRVRRSEDLVGAMLFRASSGIRKAIVSLQIAGEQDYESLLKLLSAEARDKPDAAEDPPLKPPNQIPGFQEPIPVPGTYPEFSNTQAALLRLKSVKYSGVSSKLAELYKSLLKMSTTIPEPSKTPELEFAYEPRQFSYEINKTFRVLKNQVTQEVHRRNMRALTMDSEAQTTGDVVSQEKIKALEELSQEKDLEIARLRNDLMLTRVQVDSNRNELERLVKRAPELEEKVARQDLDMVALKKKETMLLLSINEMQRNQKSEANKLEDLFKTQMRMKALLVDSDGRARKAERTSLRNEESFAQAKIMHDLNEEKMKLLTQAAEQGADPDFAGLQVKMKKQLKQVNEEFRAKREELKRKQEEMAEQLTEQISMVDQQVEEFAEIIQSPILKQKAKGGKSKLQVKPVEEDSDSLNSESNRQSLSLPKGKLAAKRERGGRESEDPDQSESEEEEENQQEKARNRGNSDESGEEMEESPRHRGASSRQEDWSAQSRQEEKRAPAGSRPQPHRENGQAKPRAGELREDSKEKGGPKAQASHSEATSPARRRMVIAPTETSAESTTNRKTTMNFPAPAGKLNAESARTWGSEAPSSSQPSSSASKTGHSSAVSGAVSQSFEAGDRATQAEAVRHSKREVSFPGSSDSEMDAPGQTPVDALAQEDEDEEIEILSQLSPTEIPLYYKVKDIFENRLIWRKEVGVKVNSKATQTLKSHSKAGKWVAESSETDGLTEITEEDSWGEWGEGAPLHSGPTGLSPVTRRRYRQALARALQGHGSGCGALCKHLLRAMQLRRKVRGTLFPVKVLNLRYRQRAK